MIEIKDTTNSNVKRLIIYFGNENYDQSIGIKLTNQELYNFYLDLREKIKEIDETLVSDDLRG